MSFRRGEKEVDMKNIGKLWAVVLAGGRGERLEPFPLIRDARPNEERCHVCQSA